MTRLLNVNNYHYRRGGSEVVYLEHALMMEGRGFECGYFSMRHPRNEPTPWSRYFIDEIEFGHEYSLTEKLAMAGKVVWSFEARAKLARLLDAFPADIVHLHCIYHHHSPAILSLFSERGIPAVMTAHDLKIACPNYKMRTHDGPCERCRDGSVWNVVRHRCVQNSLAASAVVAVESALHRALGTWRRHLAAIVCPSQFFVDKFVEWGWPRDRFVHVPNWVDAEHFEPGFEPGGYAFSFGRLVLDKGRATLIRAAHAAALPVKLAGTGPDEAALRALAAELDADVEFLGYRSGVTLHDAVRGAGCVVLASELYENAPMMLLEAMALGKPVVGARIGGIPEVIDEDGTGWLFASGSVEALAERLAAVKAMPDASLVVMGRAARAHVEQHFSRSRYLQAMLDLYAHVGVRLPITAAAGLRVTV
ncbi:MAG: glycosyltransferase family 4 protein [Betaproteobacteria bacterium]